MMPCFDPWTPSPAPASPFLTALAFNIMILIPFPRKTPQQTQRFSRVLFPRITDINILKQLVS